MPRKLKVAITAALLLMALSHHASAKVDQVVAAVPPPPGELILKFANDIPPSFDRVNLRFNGTANSNGYSAHTTLTWKFDWTDSSGEVQYGIPTIIGLDPDMDKRFSGFAVVDGCPSQVSLDFTTESPLGATVNGTFDHTCTIPEPSGTLFALAGCWILTSRRRRVR